MKPNHALALILVFIIGLPVLLYFLWPVEKMCLQWILWRILPVRGEQGVENSGGGGGGGGATGTADV
ncbi:MAG: hypothetical protein Q9167_007385, partial [Letrouitia subvulpina]